MVSLLQSLSRPLLDLADVDGPDHAAGRTTPGVAVAQITPHAVRWEWRGALVAHAFRGAVSERELLELRLGGGRRGRWRADHPDDWTARGTPIYRLDDRALRAARRLLDREGDLAFEIHNVACNQGRNNALNYMAGASTIAGGYQAPQYIAVGTQVVVPQPTDTQLGAELGRKAVTSTSVASNQVQISASFLTGDDNATWTELGLVGSDPTHTASTSINTGVLFGHASTSYPKTNLITVQVTYNISLS